MLDLIRWNQEGGCKALRIGLYLWFLIAVFQISNDKLLIYLRICFCLEDCKISTDIKSATEK